MRRAPSKRMTPPEREARESLIGRRAVRMSNGECLVLDYVVDDVNLAGSLVRLRAVADGAPFQWFGRGSVRIEGVDPDFDRVTAARVTAVKSLDNDTRLARLSTWLGTWLTNDRTADGKAVFVEVAEIEAAVRGEPVPKEPSKSYYRRGARK